LGHIAGQCRRLLRSRSWARFHCNHSICRLVNNTWIQRTWNGDRSGRLCNIFYHRSNSDALPHLFPIPRRSDRCVFLPTSHLHASLASSFRSIAVPASELHLLSLVLLSKVSQVLQLSSLLHTPECSRRPYKYLQMFLVRWHWLSSCLACR